MSMSFNIEIESGNSVKLLTAGKYCDRDIIVTGTGGLDVSATTAERSDVAYGKVFFASNGTQTTGQLSDIRGSLIDISSDTHCFTYDSTSGRIIMRPLYDAIVGSGTSEGLYIAQKWLAYRTGLISAPTDTTSDKIANGVTYLDITGTGGAIDLSPTTATASDVASGKVFFAADGTQTTGTLVDMRGTLGHAEEYSNGLTYDSTNGRIIVRPLRDAVIGSETTEGLYVDQNWLAFKTGLTSAPNQTTSTKIANGVTYLGITGTGGGGRTYTAMTKGTGNASYCYCYVTSVGSGTKYYNTDTLINLSNGDTLTCYVSAPSTGVYVDGIKQTLTSNSFTYTPDCDVSVNFRFQIATYAHIYINTPGYDNLQTKTVNITSNGTFTYTPDAGYDGLGSITFNVNV